MSTLVPPVVAGDVFLAKLEPHPRTRLRAVLGAALDLWCALSGGLLELTGSGDVVVRRRVDYAEELRIFAGPPESASRVLAEVREDLRRLTPEGFRDTWGIG